MPRWVQLVLLPLGIVGVYLLLKAAGSVLLLFIIAGLIALFLNPLVSLLIRAAHPARRGGGDRDGLRGRVSDRARLPARRPDHQPGVRASSATSRATSTTRTPRSPTCRPGSTGAGIDIEIKQEGESALQTIGERITGGAGEVVGFTRDAVQRLVEASIALILIIVLSIYMLIYGDRIGAVVRAVVPPGDGTPDDDFPTRVQAVAVRLRPRPVPVQPDHGHERGR